MEAILESGVYVREGKWTQKVSNPANLDLENDDMGAENTYFWDVYLIDIRMIPSPDPILPIRQPEFQFR